MDIRLALMTGVDIPIQELQLILHQPTIKEISLMGEEDFFEAIQYLCLEKEYLIEDKRVLETLTNFQVLMKVLEQSKDKEKKIAITTLLSLLFPNYKTAITPRSIILTGQEQNVLIDEKNFDSFQSILRKVLCTSNILQGDNVIYNPGNDKAKAIMDKLMKGRKKVAELKAKEGQQESVLSRYLSILTIGTNTMRLQDCINLTLYQLFDLIDRFNLFVNWDLDLRVRLAGGDPKQEVDNWMKEIH